MRFYICIILFVFGTFVASAQKCPSVTVQPNSYSVGETEELTFTANLKPDTSRNLTYNWSISAGTITSGQGTSKIWVSTDYVGGMTVTATVEIGGLSRNCPNNASSTVEVLKLEFDYHNWKTPYKLDTLKGWGFERFEIPVSFAPSINYKGVEDIRFTPGWAKKTSNDYWSYVFLWWLDGKQEFDPKTISTYLKEYYTGLVKVNIDTLVPAKATIRSRTTEKNDLKTFEGSVTMLDYMTKKPITLNIVVHIRSCPGKDKTFVFHELSPMPYSNEVWKRLHQFWINFKCDAN